MESFHSSRRPRCGLFSSSARSSWRARRARAAAKAAARGEGDVGKTDDDESNRKELRLMRAQKSGVQNEVFQVMAHSGWSHV